MEVALEEEALGVLEASFSFGGILGEADSFTAISARSALSVFLDCLFPWQFWLPFDFDDEESLLETLLDDLDLDFAGAVGEPCSPPPPPPPARPGAKSRL